MGAQVPMRDWARRAARLDAGHLRAARRQPSAAALRRDAARAALKLEDVEHTPSARLLRELREREQSFEALALRVSREHKAVIPGVRAIRPDALARIRGGGRASRCRRSRAIEAARRGSFEDYLAAYLAD